MNYKAVLETILTGEQLDIVEKYIDLIMLYNQRFNLVSRRSVIDDLYRYVLDSLGLVEFLSTINNAEIVDIGSGAGFPGVPLSILGYQCNLVEINTKKADFLNEIVDKLNISAKVYHRDAKFLKYYDFSNSNLVVVAKAVSSCKNIIDMCNGLISQNTTFLLLKGPSYPPEIDDLQLKWSFKLQQYQNRYTPGSLIIELKNLNKIK